MVLAEPTGLISRNEEGSIPSPAPLLDMNTNRHTPYWLYCKNGLWEKFSHISKELIEKNARAFRTSDSFHTKYQIAIEIDATCEQWTFASDTLDELFDDQTIPGK